jgi:hypothetical protein
VLLLGFICVLHGDKIFNISRNYKTTSGNISHEDRDSMFIQSLGFCEPVHMVPKPRRTSTQLSPPQKLQISEPDEVLSNSHLSETFTVAMIVQSVK